MKTLDSDSWLGVVQKFAAMLGLMAMAGLVHVRAASPTLGIAHDAYAIGEEIQFQFANGPGNSKDWVGIYPADVVPGAQASTAWNYVGGTQTAGIGLSEGVVAFPSGLSFAGDWKAYLLENDGYTVLAEVAFKIVDVGTPLVRMNKRVYAPGENIVAQFISGPGNAKDWIGIYHAGEIPGGPNSTIWNYVDGTHSGNTGSTDGTVSFTGGLTQTGDYIAYFLVDDSYTILASETFTVAIPAANQPRILSLSPANGASGTAPQLQFSAIITNGLSKVVTSSVTLSVDGLAVAPSVVAENNRVVVTYNPAPLLAPLSAHTYTLGFKDDANPANSVSATGSFTVAAYENIQLPAPIVYENFDSTPEGQVPAGWTLKSFTEVQNPDFDLGNLDSASYANFTVVAATRFEGSFVTYSDPTNPESWATDYHRVLTSNPLNVVNGAVVTTLASGNLLFGDSGYRNGRSQVLYASTPDYDLTGKSDVYVVFNSLYEQNQDSMAALEYSIDRGASWMPVFYLLDGPDILKNDAGEVDAEATFNTSASDIAVYTDENGNDVGGTYGAFIGAPISPSLAPFIQARVNDDTRESKRVEKYRLAKADGQAHVRLRFAYAGTDSWYWGIDNLGLYSIPTTVTPPTLAYSVTNDGLVLSWPAGTLGYVLESAPRLNSATWTAVSGVTGNSVVVPFSEVGQVFRLRQP